MKKATLITFAALTVLLVSTFLLTWNPKQTAALSFRSLADSKNNRQVLKKNSQWVDAAATLNTQSRVLTGPNRIPAIIAKGAESNMAMGGEIIEIAPGVGLPLILRKYDRPMAAPVAQVAWQIKKTFLDEVQQARLYHPEQFSEIWQQSLQKADSDFRTLFGDEMVIEKSREEGIDNLTSQSSNL